MMPSSKFAVLAKSPYVAEDPAQRNLARQTLTQAVAGLGILKGKIADGKESAEGALLAYQVMYQCAKALAQASAYKVDHFRSLVSALRELYVKPGRLEAELVVGLEQALKVAPGTAQHVAYAERWVEKTQALIGLTS